MGNDMSSTVDCCVARAGNARIETKRYAASQKSAIIERQSAEPRPIQDDRVGIGAYFMRCPDDPTKVEVRSMLAHGPADKWCVPSCPPPFPAPVTQPFQPGRPLRCLPLCIAAVHASFCRPFGWRVGPSMERFRTESCAPLLSVSVPAGG